MAGIIDNFIDWAAPKIKGFLGGAASFLKKDTPEVVPKYMHGTGLNKQFYETLRNMNDADIPDFIKGYSKDAYKELIRGSINGGTRLDAFNNMHKTYKAEVLKGYGKAHKAEIDMMNAFNALDYGEAFQIKTQGQLDKIYSAINQDNFSTEYFKHQVRLAEQGKGMFAKEFDFDFSNGGKNLNKEQMQALGKYFDEGGYSERLSNFTADYLPEEAEDVSRLNYNLGMQRRYLRTEEGQRQLELINGGRKSPINQAIKKNKEYEDAYNAYKSHLSDRLATQPDIDTPWNKPLSFDEFGKKNGYATSYIEKMSNALNSTSDTMNSQINKKNAKKVSSGNPDHSGIGLWQKVKDHPVIATSVVMGTAWGISELVEDDSL